jgi:hypothetical protein
MVSKRSSGSYKIHYPSENPKRHEHEGKGISSLPDDLVLHLQTIVQGMIPPCMTHEIRFPKSFSYTVQLISRRTRHDEVFRSRDTSNPISVGIETNQNSESQFKRSTNPQTPFSRHSRALGRYDTHVSILQIKGLGLGSIVEGAGIPAITGSIKYGPNL